MKLNLYTSLFLILFIHSCGIKKVEKQPLKPGKYTTTRLTNKEVRKYKEKFGYTIRLLKDVILLKEDGTYITGGCNGKIAYSGNWHSTTDSLYFTNIKCHIAEIEPKEFAIFHYNGRLFPKFFTIPDHKPFYSVLKIGGKLFDGNIK